MNAKRCGIVLAGGSGTRLGPLTKVISKQLLPVYDKPMVYYPLSTLISAGISDIAIIANPSNCHLFETLLGTGSQWGVSLTYIQQERPEGIAQAFVIAEEFIDERPCALVLGDNLFHGDLGPAFARAKQRTRGATVFGYKVKDPERYGVLVFDGENRVKEIVEKPTFPLSEFAVTGLYFYDTTVCQKAKKLNKSQRGEYEITDLNNMYSRDNELCVELLEEGFAWLDTGTPDSLHEAASYVQTMQHRQGVRIGCPDTAAQRRLMAC